MNDQSDMPVTSEPQAGQAAEVPKDQRTMGMLCHMLALAILIAPGIANIVGPLILWLIKKDASDFVDDQGKESINFQITMSIAMLLCVPLVVTWILIPVIYIADVIFIIIAALKANEGERYRYPFAIRFLK